MRPGEDQLKAWMTAGLDGDAASHALLLGALVPLLRQFYRRRIGDDAEIEDLVQDVLIAVHTRRASYDRDRLFTPWLFSIARYKLVDRFRRSQATSPIEDLAHILSVEGFEEASNASIDIDRLLGTLPPKQANAIRQTQLDGLSTAEAAAAGQIGESDVKVSVHRGLKALAARLRGDAK
jgi:RNA polymerase sigma-70 factor (ECF subfamily)